MTTTTLFELKVPSLGESISEATIARWAQSDGAWVDAKDIVAELETDKAAVEQPATQAGILKILKQKGATVAIGEVIATIDPAGKRPSSDAPTSSAPQPAAKGNGFPLSPAVQRMVTENKLDPAKIPATGKDGRLTKEDILKQSSSATTSPADAAAAAGSPRQNNQQPMNTSGTTAVYTAPPAAPTIPTKPGEGETRIEMTKLRQTIAKRLVESQHATASLTTFNEIDMSAVMALREKYKEKFEKTHQIGLGFMSFFARAVIHALKAVPAANALIDGNALVYRSYVNLGIAVSTEKGLMVPVLRNANQLSMAQIESEIKRLAAKAREGKITVDDMSGGTFTITNGGVFGSLLSTPILNPPQSGILGMHKIEKRAVVISEGGKDSIEIRPMMYVALTYDHRVIDGQQSVTFLVKVKEAIEDPTRLLLEI